MFDSLFSKGKRNQGGGGMFSQPSGYYADDHWSLVHGGGDGYCCQH